MKFRTYAAPTFLGLFLSFFFMVAAMSGGKELAQLYGGLLVVAYAITIGYVVKKGDEAAYLLALPMVMVLGVVLFVHFGKELVAKFMPDSQELIAECKTTGVEFVRQPSAPVKSIFYEWNGNVMPPFALFHMVGTRITSISYTSTPVDAQHGVDFVEMKTSYVSRDSSTPTYIRYLKPGKSQKVSDLTADVSVHYQISPEEELLKAYPEQGMIRYELTVMDRRTGEKLATKKYVIDAKNKRACGPEISDRTFILKSLALE
jgi:hypothetical protein